jgi:hypothetical protein
MTHNEWAKKKKSHKKFKAWHVSKTIEILDLEQVCRYVGTGLAGNLLQRNNFSAVYKTSLHFTK